MKKVVLIAGLATLAVGGIAAAASTTQFPQDFHGLSVLGNSDGETSGSTRVQPAVAKLGPYATDAVVVMSWEGEVSYVNAHRLVHAVIALKRDGVALSAVHPAMLLAGPGSLRQMGDERLFLAKGQQTTLSVEAGGDPADAPMARARLVATAIATSK